MKNKEDLIKKSDNNSEQEETKSLDNSPTQKVQRMDQQDISLKNLQKQNEFINHNKDTIVDTALEKPKPSNYDEKQKKAAKLQEYIDKIDPEVKARLTTQKEVEFYAKCSMYLDAVDPDQDDYLTLYNVLGNYSSHIEINEYVKNNIFAARRDTASDKETGIINLKIAVATTYKVCVDNQINLRNYNTLYSTIKDDLMEVLDVNLSGEIMSFIEQYQYEVV